MDNSSAPDIDQRFSDFIFMQAQSAGLFLGQIPNPATGDTSINLQAAESIINTLEMLHEKTRGNLSEAEKKLLSTARENIGNLFEKSRADSETA